MYRIKNEDAIKDFEGALGLLNQLEVKGIQNVNILGNAYAFLTKFISSIEKIEEEVIIDNTKKEEKK